jgi:ribonuclease E
VAAEGAEVTGDTAVAAAAVPPEAVQAQAPETATEAAEGAPLAAAEETGEGTEPRRRRRPRREREPAAEALEAAAEAEGAVSARADVGEASAETTVVAEEPQVAGVPLEAATEVLAPVAEAVVAAPEPAVAAFELPLTDLQALAESAGLQWVHSDTDKVRAVQEAMAAEPQPVHVPREIRPVVLIDEGPLVLVETRKDLAQVQLPFEVEAAQ